MPDRYQYQTFEDAIGQVDSYKKLKAFQLPPLKNLSFLDVGCNEGYYCGVALLSGAKKVTGIDSFNLAIERAKVRYPTAEFLCADWTNLPVDKYDVILFSSSMHYIDNELSMFDIIEKLSNSLSHNGLLIIETGISKLPGKQIEIVERSIGRVYYPSRLLMADMLARANLAWRDVAESEPGDNIPRLVFHCRNMQHTIVIIKGKSGDGKSYLSESLANFDLERIIVIDEILKDTSKDFNILVSNKLSGYLPAYLDLCFEKNKVETFLNSIVSNIINKVKLVCDYINTKELPVQIPIIIEGFITENSNYDVLLHLLVSKLEQLQFRCWEITPNFIAKKNPWITNKLYLEKQYVDFGGYLLENINFNSGYLRSISVGPDLICFSVEVFGNININVMQIMADDGSSLSSPLTPQRCNDTFYKFFINKDKLYNEITVTKNLIIGDSSQLNSIHFIIKTSDFTCFCLHKIFMTNTLIEEL